MRAPPKSIATPGRPPADTARDARELLLSSATELFAIHGVPATTFAMIAKRAGLTPAMLHYYFKGRDQLIDAVVEERLLRIVSHVWDPVEPQADANETARGIVQRLVESIEAMPWVPSLWIREILHEGGLLRERMLSHAPFDKARLFASAIARGQADGSLNPTLDPLLAVSSTIGLVMINFAATQIWAQALHRKPLNTQTVQRHITGLLLDGLCHRRPDRSNTASRKKQR
jgi:TetR/AcrR family transcriptional regulator